MSISLIIVDDHPAVASGLALLLPESLPDIQVTAVITDPTTALDEVARCRPQVVLTDMSMPNLPGPQLIAQLTKQPSPPRVIVWSALEDRASIGAAFSSGATNYLTKDEPVPAIAQAIVDAVAGTPRYSPRVSAALAQAASAPAPVSLSKREIEILTRVSQGQTNRQICRELHLSEATVKTYLARCYSKLGAHDRASAVRTAMQQGLLAG